MRSIDAGTSGATSPATTLSWDELKLAPLWRAVVEALGAGHAPRPVQAEALLKHKILGHRRNLLVSAPTNSGKSLVGTLALLEAVSRGRRAVLIEPLRALAREKAEELEGVASRLSSLLGHTFKVRLSTGDYRLEDETFTDPPPNGEIIVGTPERLESILRKQEHAPWLSTIGAVCVDEAHLIGAPRRGPILEYLITSLLCAPTPPRLVLLSATLGGTTRALEWLAPCELISSSQREPPLAREIFVLSEDEDASRVVCDFVTETLAEDESASVLVFVYQTRSAERLAGKLQERLAKAGAALAYHSRMTKALRERVRQAFMAGECRCVVATTALALGVNLPATHVVVRDSTFPGVGKLSVTDLVQMTGRAGRGDRAGRAVILVRPTDGWEAEELAAALREERIPPLVSAFEQSHDGWKDARGRTNENSASGCALVATQLARHHDVGLTQEELEAFFVRSLGGAKLAREVRPALGWLADPARVLAHMREDGRYHLTALGRAATEATLPPKVAAGYANLLRDLLTVDPSDGLLANWRPLDHLVTLELLSDTSPFLRPYGAKLAGQLRGWMETPREDNASMLYREWIAGEADTSRAGELLGSLGLTSDRARKSAGKTEESWAHNTAHLALLRAVVIYERGAGASVEDLTRRWSLPSFEGVEERWRDNLLWLLSGVAQVLDLPSFYYHLREECVAGQARVRRVKLILKRMRAQAYELREHLKYCSPLGSLLRSMRRTLSAKKEGQRIGAGTIRHLEAAGVHSFADLRRLELDELVKLGVRRDFARQIKHYVKRRALT